MLIKKMCPFCGLENVVEMPDTSYAVWQAGVLIQDAWPSSTPAMREAVLTGSHEHCWATIWLENYDMEDTTDEILSRDISDIPHFIRNALYPKTDTIIPMELSEAEKDLIHDALTRLRDLAELEDAETADIDALITRFAS